MDSPVDAVRRWLDDRIDGRTRFLKAREIGESLGLPSQTVGAVMAALQREGGPLRVEKWALSRHAYCWKVERIR